MPDLPSNPQSNAESYLASIAGEAVDLPVEPQSRVEQYLAYIVEHGGGGGGSIPTNVSELVNDANYQNADQVLALIRQELAGITSLEIALVDELPEYGVKGTIYLVPNGGATPNTKDEYLWIASLLRFEKIGTTEIDISGKQDKLTPVGSSTRGVYVSSVGTVSQMSHSLNEDVPSGFAPATGSPLEDGTANVGTSNKYAREDHRHPTDTSRASTAVATTSANGLMSSADKAKLDNMNVPAGGISMPETISNQAVASFTSASAERPLRVTAHIEAVQAGSGDPSPSNVKPITGWTGANIVVTNSPATITITPTQASGTPSPSNPLPITGVTLPQAGTVYGGTLDVAERSLTVTHKKVTFTGNESWNIMTNSGGYVSFSTTLSDIFYIPADGSALGDIICSHYELSDANAQSRRQVDRSVAQTGRDIRIRDTSFADMTADEWKTWLNGHNIDVVYPIATPITYQLTPQESNTALSALGYNGNVFSIFFPSPIGTVYGGTLDVARGLLTVTHDIVDLGTLSWETIANTGYFATANLRNKVKLPANNNVLANAICEAYPVVTLSDAFSNAVPLGIAVQTSPSLGYVTIRDRNKAELSAADFAASLSGVRFVYQLASPVTYQLTPQQLTTLANTNNVFADCGLVTVMHWPGTGTPVEPVEDGEIAWKAEVLRRLEALGG